MHRQILSAGQVADRLNISTSRVSRLVASGQLVALEELPGLGRVFDAAHVERVAAERADAARDDWRMRTPRNGPQTAEGVAGA